jgi:hypothetical protein
MLARFGRCFNSFYFSQLIQKLREYMINALVSFNSANLSETILQSNKYKEVRREWLQDEKLSDCEDYFHRLISEKHLILEPTVSELAKLLYQDPKKQRYAAKNAYRYRNCWYVRTSQSLLGESSTKLDVIQIKVPKAVQEETQEYYNQKHRREGGELKKSPKYLSSQGVPAPIFLMPIADRDHHLVKNNPNLVQDKGLFDLVATTWEQVRSNPNIPIIIIEGYKKGAILAAHGYFVIVLPGVWQGLRKGEEYGKEIHEIIDQFATYGRQFFICFDNDPVEKKGTKESVGLALLQLGKKLQIKTACHTRVITWELPEKGADDLIAERGIGEFHAAFRLAKKLGEWEAIHSYAIYEKPDLEFNERYIPAFDIPEIITKVLIKSTQGTGKSRQIKRLIKKWLKKGYGVVAVTMSDSLKKQSCDKWGLSTIEAIWNGSPIIKNHSDHQLYIGEKAKGKTRSLTGFMGCIDSVYKLYTKIRELIDNGIVKGFVLILDEVEALFDHLLTSSTEVAKNLPENIRMFRELIHDCHLLIAADADASGLTWDLINKLKGGKSFYIKNNYKHRNRTVVHWKDYYEMINLGLLKIAKSGTKKAILITTQGGKLGSKTGAYTLDDVLAGNLDNDDMEQDHNNAMDAYKVLECSGRKIWVVTARTVSDIKHPCYQVIRDEETFNKFIQKAGNNGDIVIISNVIPTGFSIECDNFGYQFSFGTGVNNPCGFVQHINRLRGDDCERHIAVATLAMAKYGNGSTTYKGILAGIKYTAKANKDALAAWYNIEFEDVQEDSLFATYSAKIFARNNAASQEYESWVIGRLKYECGYKIVSSEDWLEARTETFQNQNPTGEITYSENEIRKLKEGTPFLKGDIKHHAAKDMIRRYQMVADQKPCSADEYKYLQDKKRKGEFNQITHELERLSPDESDRLLRAEFVEHTGGTLPITADNLKKYDQDGFLSKLRLFHHATIGRDQVGELSAIALEHACKGKKQLVRKTNSKIIAGKLKFLSDKGCDTLLSTLYKIVQCQSPDQNFYNNYIDRNLDQNFDHFDQFFALYTPNDLNLDLNLDPNNKTPNINPGSPNDGLGGGVVRVEILPKGFDKIREAFGKDSYGCKQLLGITPATKYPISFIRQFLGLFGFEVLTEGSRRSEKHYLVVPQDVRLYLNFLQARNQPKPLLAPENKSIMELILDKSSTGGAVTTYIKNAVTGLPALGEATTLSELAEWGSMQQPVIDSLQVALDAGYEAYGVARQQLFDEMQEGDPNPILNRIISEAISTFEQQNKDKIAKIQPIFWSSKEAIASKELWLHEIENKNPAALLIDRIRRGVNATQAFIQECRETYQRYSQCFDSWLSQKLISPLEYQAVRGS